MSISEQQGIHRFTRFAPVTRSLKNKGANRVAQGVPVRTPESYNIANTAQGGMVSVAAELELQNFQTLKTEQLQAEK